MIRLIFYYAIAILIFLTLPQLVHGQSKNLVIHVIDSLSKEPLQDAVIREIPSGRSFQARKDGICPVSANTDSIIVSYIGYRTKKLKLARKICDTIVLKRYLVQLQDVAIVNGTRLDTYRLLSSIDLNLQPVKSAQDLLRLIPGLFIAQHMGGGKAEQIFIRGFDADHGTDINISVDGMPVNMVTHAHGQGYADLHFVIPETVESYDFGKGPYYADKGDFTTAGFVSYASKSSVPENEIKLQAGKFDSFRMMEIAKLKNSLGRPNGESAYIAADELYSNGGPFEFPEHFDRLNLFGKYVKKIGDNNVVTADFFAFHSKWRSSGEIPDRALSEGYVNSRFGVIDSAQGGLTDRVGLILKMVSDIRNGWSMTNNAYLTYYDFSLISNFTFYYYFPDQGDEFRQSEKRKLAGYNGTLTNSKDFGSLLLTTDFGSGIRLDHISPIRMDHMEDGNFLAAFRIDDANEYNGNLWADETLKTGKWLFNLGVRLDYFVFNVKNLLPTDTSAVSGTTEKGTVSPKINISYNVNDQVLLYIKSGKGFHSNDARVVTANKGFEVLPAAYGADLGINYKPLKNLFINAAGWYLFLQQEFRFGQDLSDQLEGPISPSGRTARLGVDLSVRYQINPWLFANLNGNLAHARYLDSARGHNYVALAPTFTSTAGLNFHSKNGFYGGISYRYLHDRPGDSDNTLTARGYFITDLTVNYRHKNYELGLAIENLFNVVWDESQIAYIARLKNEANAVEQISYTPGVPFFPKLKFTRYF